MTALTAAAPPMAADRPASGALSRAEAAALSPLLAALGCRMLGLFLLLPVLAPYVMELEAGSAELAGLALGAYGLTQAAMLLPLGWLSDRWGRKPVLCAGLLVFAAGGLLAASAAHPAAVVAGRALQGMGAISAVVLAGISDLTPPAKRAQGMALAGVAIGGAFALAIVLAAPLAALAGVRGLFIGTAVLALAAIPAVLACPLPAPRPAAADSAFIELRVLPYCLGVFGIHWAMAALFFHLPLRLAAADAPPAWLVYLLGFNLSLAVAVPLLLRRLRGDGVLWFAAPLLAAGLLLAPQLPGAALTIGALAAFFAGFNLLEALLPARASLAARAAGRGAALGAYAVCQALGVFVGAAVAGRLAAEHGDLGLYLAGAAALIWLPALRWAR
ncbi:MAG: MFS transporter [Betaproteobacteria bacterium AqS2]|uniref:MFS transporter n=1 Tax=Candidatus Amphirhobacter heronislandensis TaxID=1732024 RepID=A0A930UD43_9GAMM|nr:MFS transporter [Betaproteobacteria bacterium AqS2]